MFPGLFSIFVNFFNNYSLTTAEKINIEKVAHTVPTAVHARAMSGALCPSRSRAAARTTKDYDLRMLEPMHRYNLYLAVFKILPLIILLVIKNRDFEILVSVFDNRYAE